MMSVYRVSDFVITFWTIDIYLAHFVKFKIIALIIYVIMPNYSMANHGNYCLFSILLLLRGCLHTIKFEVPSITFPEFDSPENAQH